MSPRTSEITGVVLAYRAPAAISSSMVLASRGRGAPSVRTRRSAIMTATKLTPLRKNATATP